MPPGRVVAMSNLPIVLSDPKGYVAVNIDDRSYHICPLELLNLGRGWVDLFAVGGELGPSEFQDLNSGLFHLRVERHYPGGHGHWAHSYFVYHISPDHRGLTSSGHEINPFDSSRIFIVVPPLPPHTNFDPIIGRGAILKVQAIFSYNQEEDLPFSFSDKKKFKHLISNSTSQQSSTLPNNSLQSLPSQNISTVALSGQLHSLSMAENIQQHRLLKDANNPPVTENKTDTDKRDSTLHQQTVAISNLGTSSEGKKPVTTEVIDIESDSEDKIMTYHPSTAGKRLPTGYAEQVMATSSHRDGDNVSQASSSSKKRKGKGKSKSKRGKFNELVALSDATSKSTKLAPKGKTPSGEIIDEYLFSDAVPLHKLSYANLEDMEEYVDPDYEWPTQPGGLYWVFCVHNDTSAQDEIVPGKLAIVLLSILTNSFYRGL